MKQLRETIMQGNEMFKETNYAKTNDQQWYEVASDSFDVRKTWTQCMSVSGTSENSALRFVLGVRQHRDFQRQTLNRNGQHHVDVGRGHNGQVRILLVFLHGLQRETARTGVTMVQEHWRRHWRRLHSHGRWDDL